MHNKRDYASNKMRKERGDYRITLADDKILLIIIIITNMSVPILTVSRFEQYDIDKNGQLQETFSMQSQ